MVHLYRSVGQWHQLERNYFGCGFLSDFFMCCVRAGGNCRLYSCLCFSAATRTPKIFVTEQLCSPRGSVPSAMANTAHYLILPRFNVQLIFSRGVPKVYPRTFERHIFGFYSERGGGSCQRKGSRAPSSCIERWRLIFRGIIDHVCSANTNIGEFAISSDAIFRIYTWTV